MCQSQRMPVIGLMPLIDPKRESYWMLPGYMEGLMAAGALPLMLPLTQDPDRLDPLLSLCDGLLLTGGQDVSPAIYRAEALPTTVCCPERDRMEAPLLELALERDLPVLGICRGLQFLNAALGGTLYQDLPTEHPSSVSHGMQPPYDRVSHRVALPAGTPLQQLLELPEIGVNSRHHQAIRDLAPSLEPMALAPDGLVEAVYMPGKRFVWGVQWHPELFWPKDASSRRILQAFVAACGGSAPSAATD